MQGIGQQYLRTLVVQGSVDIATATWGAEIFRAPLGCFAYVEAATIRALAGDGASAWLGDGSADASDALTELSAMAAAGTPAAFTASIMQTHRGLYIASGVLWLAGTGGAAAERARARVQIGLWVPQRDEIEPAGDYEGFTAQEELALIENP